MSKPETCSRRERITLEGVSAFQQASWQLAATAVRGIDIFTQDLEARIYDQQPFLESVQRLATHSRFSRIRILLQSNDKVRQHGHRLVALATRLPSRIEIRRPHPDYSDQPENFLVTDRSGYVRRHRSNGYQGEANYANRLQATRLTRLFDEIWERSEVDSSLRLLHI